MAAFLILRRKTSSWSNVSPDVIEGIKILPQLIHNELKSSNEELQECSRYLFDGRGKAVRPTMVLLMAATCNVTQYKRSFVTPAQQTVAMVTEMIHTATLVHDDIIDNADTRRGKPSVNKIWGERKAVLTGNFILAEASRVLATTENPQVIDLLSNVLEDLVRGEVMQLDSYSADEKDGSLFEQYLAKTFKKTASLMAHSCQAVAILSKLNEQQSLAAYEYGKNTGLAFQVVDDVLDFKASQSVMGKPVSVDLKLGLATAPVLYALEEEPDLYELIERKFQEPGDVSRALSAVYKTTALERSMKLARDYSNNAIGFLAQFTDCHEKNKLSSLANEIISRER